MHWNLLFQVSRSCKICLKFFLFGRRIIQTPQLVIYKTYGVKTFSDDDCRISFRDKTPVFFSVLQCYNNSCQSIFHEF